MGEADKRIFSLEKVFIPRNNLFGVLCMHNKFMKKVLRLAVKGWGKVSPNPLVGALVVKDGKILSQGYHHHFGGPHAEAVALNKLDRSAARDSTLYVNLEPCVHQGKTPPCVDKIIDYGIGKVVIGMEDPNPLVKHKGIEKLQTAGIKVELGIREKECREINEAFIKSVTQHKSFVTLKIAQTLDGKIAQSGGESKWITSEKARKSVHTMRKAADCILVGVNTVLQDNCKLTVRRVGGKGGKRVILDTRLRIPLDVNVLSDANTSDTIIVTTSKAPPNKIDTIRQRGASVWIVDANQEGLVDIGKLLEKIYEQGMISVLVEGGKRVFTSFLGEREVDKLVIFIAPRIFGSGIESFGQLNNIISPASFSEIEWNKRGNEMIFKGWL
jgi:diaminohydroxyphosphoribosylaminopyrimidine deaminase/5-amino-6-(5-phosphoribosylamino)uracil reductase